MYPLTTWRPDRGPNHGAAFGSSASQKRPSVDFAPRREPAPDRAGAAKGAPGDGPNPAYRHRHLWDAASSGQAIGERFCCTVGSLRHEGSEDVSVPSPGRSPCRSDSRRSSTEEQTSSNPCTSVRTCCVSSAPASMQDVKGRGTRVLTEASIGGKVDYLRGLKENVTMRRADPGGDGVPVVQARADPAGRAAASSAVSPRAHAGTPPGGGRAARPAPPPPTSIVWIREA